ncbi:hypothetical protein SH601_15110 [Gracilibacillus sp. S3-1-1]|uniref:Uncharacterized protein n=1 Tax=Gracilibacillus pellucidus TaxID=3095368 RepID=A0ACC6M8V9_9BACI|nr:hypothetical protein [Gracilibacillus sp. S3-1-1]MDX8047298.1 hypothetical protein [Gracilibacillus sp. S3-1-1]
MKNKWCMIIIVSFGLLLAACSAEEIGQYSPDQVVAKAVEVSEDINGYYLKSDLIVSKGEEKIEDSVMEQWTDKENYRIKTISETANGESSMTLNDGKTITMYSSLQDEAFTMDALDPNDTLIGQSPREEMEHTLKHIRETHDIETVGDEEINGFDTYHIKAIPKEDDMLRGEEEYWVDKENWFVIRTLSKSGDVTVEYTVTELEMNPSFDEETFTMDIPDGVNIEPIDDKYAPEETTLAALVELYGQPVLTSEDYDLAKIDKLDMDSFDRTEANQEFTKDGVSQFILTSFEVSDEDLPVDLAADKELEVRDVKAIYIDDVIKNLMWDEEGIRYSILANNEELTKEDLVEIAENLVFVEE